MDSLDVSIIIVNWNIRDILLGCLRSVYEQTRGIDYEVIVIDNASSDGSAEMVKKEFPQAILISNPDNRGFAAANNQGMAIAKGRYVLLLNPDTIVLDGAIQKSVAYANDHQDIGVLGCQVWLNDKEIQKTCFAFPSVQTAIFGAIGLKKLFPKSILFGKEKIGWWDRTSPREVDVVSGMFMLVRRAAIEQVGLMDEAYFIYAEETDWCFRFKRAGWKCAFTTIARIIHLDGGSKSTEQTSVKMFVQQQKSLLIFYKKQRSLASWLIAKAIYTFSMLIRYAIFVILSFFQQDNNASKKAAQSLAALKFHLFGVEPNNVLK
jgi:GT2 family glycosyltransferase